MTDRSRARSFKQIDIYKIKNLNTGTTIDLDILTDPQFLSSFYSDVDLPVDSNTTTLIPLGTVTGNTSGITYDEVTRTLFLQGHTTYQYNLKLFFEIDQGNRGVLQTWVETSTNGIDFTPVPTSGKVKSFLQRTDGVINYSGDFTVRDPIYVRFRCNTDEGQGVVTTKVLSGVNGVVNPAVTFDVRSTI